MIFPCFPRNLFFPRKWCPNLSPHLRNLQGKVPERLEGKGACCTFPAAVFFRPRCNEGFFNGGRNGGDVHWGCLSKNSKDPWGSLGILKDPWGSLGIRTG